MDEPETYVPEHMREPFQRWIEYGISPGSFGFALLSNDLKGSFLLADHINSRHIKSIFTWFYNYAPSDCWGSVENVQNWKGIDK
jgi:hypothetical protein